MMATVSEKFVGSTGGGNAGTHHSNCYKEVVVEDHQQKVPVWIGLNCKLVSGISKSTTCHDLIASIVPASQDSSKYVLIEKWKKMERILDPSVKILKVWKAWGDQIADVSFVLRSSSTGDGYIDKKSSRKVHRKRSSSYHQPKSGDVPNEECDKEDHRDAMEQLIKLVITQGEAIQAQLKKLRQQEEQIEKYEEKMHKIRSTQHGENYVVDTYLNDETTKTRRPKREKSPCKRDSSHYHHHHPKKDGESSKVTEVDISTKSGTNPASAELHVPPVEDESPESKEELLEKTELLESIFQLNVRLTQEEERLVKLGLKIRKLSDKQRKAEWEELALQDISQELEILKQVTNEQSQEIDANERNLTCVDQLLDDKHDHLAFLTHEIQLVDEQSEMLKRKLLELKSMGMNVEHLLPSEDLYDTSEFAYLLSQGDEDQSEKHFEVEQPSPASSGGKEKKASLNQSTSYKMTSLAAPSGASARFKCQVHETCSSSCSNSSSVCVQLSQKQCISSTTNDPQDNDSNSDTGISSLHSSVDDNPMYVLDTLV